MRAYSYIRFSSGKQAYGDSLRRQTALARDYAGRHGIELDESLTYRDLGVSAFKSSNAETGALSVFIDAVRTGAVPAGSMLLVEQMDRLSRANVYVAFSLLQTLLEAGITVVTLSPEQVYSKESSRDLSSLMMALVTMHRAHEESAVKSDRLRKAWGAKRERRETMLTSECPKWLAPRPDRSGFDVIPDRVESVQRVYDLTIAGLGATAIVRMANAERWPCPGKGATWHTSLIVRILSNEAVLGRFCPKVTTDSGKSERVGDVWEDYYPKIISDKTFQLARAAKVNKSKLPGRRDAEYRNIFQGILRCGYCGGSFVRKNKASMKQPGYAIYMCGNRIRGLTTCPSQPSYPLEWYLTQSIYLSAYERISPDVNIKRLQDEVILLQEKHGKAKASVERIVDAIVATDSPALIVKLPSAEQAVRDAEQELASAEAELTSFRTAVSDTDYLLTKTHPADFERLRDEKEVIFRSELREKLLRLVESVFVFPDHATIAIKYKQIENLSFAPLGAMYNRNDNEMLAKYIHEEQYLKG